MSTLAEFDRLDRAGIALFHKNSTGRYISINKIGALMLGADSSDVIGRKDQSFFASSSAELMFQRDLEIVHAGRAQMYSAVAEVGLTWKRFLSTKLPVESDAGEKLG